MDVVSGDAMNLVLTVLLLLVPFAVVGGLLALLNRRTAKRDPMRPENAGKWHTTGTQSRFPKD